MIKETLFFELSAANSIPAFMFHKGTPPCSFFGVVPSALIITRTPFTLFIFHNSHFRSKNKFSVLMLVIEYVPFIVQFSSVPSNTSNHKRVDIPLGDLLVFDVRLSKIRIKTV